MPAGELLAVQRNVSKRYWFVVSVVAVVLNAAASLTADEVKPAERLEALKRAQVWTPTDIPSIDMTAGPDRKDAFQTGEIISCDYLGKKMTGRSPKFACVIPPDDEVKVKFGRDNGEVYGEVVATRLLWALGFGADAMYPVKVLCHNCPQRLGGVPHDGRLDEI